MKNEAKRNHSYNKLRRGPPERRGIFVQPRASPHSYRSYKPISPDNNRGQRVSDRPYLRVCRYKEANGQNREEQNAKGWKPAKARPRKVSAALKAYAKLVMSADKGAVRDLSLLDD